MIQMVKQSAIGPTVNRGVDNNVASRNSFPISHQQIIVGVAIDVLQSPHTHPKVPVEGGITLEFVRVKI